MQSKLDQHEEYIYDMIKNGKTYREIRDSLKSEKGVVISLQGISNWVNEPHRTKTRINHATYHQTKRLIAKEKSDIETRIRIHTRLNELVSDVMGKWATVKDTLEPKSLEGMLAQVIKLLELAGKFEGIINSGSSITFNLGSSDEEDKSFINFLRMKLEQAHYNWNDLLEEFQEGRKVKKKINIIDDVIDVEAGDPDEPGTD